MRPPVAAVVGTAALAAVAVGCSGPGEYDLRAEADSIREIADSAERVEAARAFLEQNAAADSALLGDMAIDLVSSIGEIRGHEAGIAAADSMLGGELHDYVRFSVEGVLTTELLQTEAPENLARADEISRHLLVEDVDHPYGYTHLASYWTRAVRSGAADADPWLAVDLAVKGVEKADGNWTDYAGSVLSYAYATALGGVEDARGPEGVRAVVDSLLTVTDNPDAVTNLRGELYDLTVEDDPEAAVAIAESIELIMGRIVTGDVLNSVAFDLAERDLAPTLAVSLAERALELTSTRWDSVYVLDTVGWAHHKAGDNERASACLSRALDLVDEDPTFDDEILQHLLAVCDAAGDIDRSIELLIGVAARSLDEGAVDALESKLIARDGSAQALERLLAENRYTGVRAAPAFVLPDRSGEVTALADLTGRVSIVSFWSYGCSPCRAELPHLVELAERFADRPVTVVSIDGGKRSDAASAFLDENNVRHLVLNDEARATFDDYGVAGIPTTVIIDHAGRIMFRHVGFVPGLEERFAQEIETLLGWIEEA